MLIIQWSCDSECTLQWLYRLHCSHVSPQFLNMTALNHSDPDHLVLALFLCWQNNQHVAILLAIVVSLRSPNHNTMVSSTVLISRDVILHPSYFTCSKIKNGAVKVVMFYCEIPEHFNVGN